MKLRNIYIVPFLFLTFSVSAQSGNTNLGLGSLRLTSNGSFNVAIGDSTLTSLTNELYTIGLGYAAGKNSSSSSSIFGGFKAGYNTTTGNNNLFMGYLSGYYTSTGNDNTFLGNQSGFNNSNGNSNTFIGEGAGYGNTNGSSNTIIGHRAGASSYRSVFPRSTGLIPVERNSNPTGSHNVALGSFALEKLTTGFRNTAVGRSSGTDMNSSLGEAPSDVLPSIYGSYNTIVGDSTATDIGRGAYNTVIGQAAGKNIESGSRNTFVGFKAGEDNNRTNEDNAHLNTFLGYRTGRFNREGSNNVFIGARSGLTINNSGGINDYNLILGVNSQINLNKDYNVIVGHNSTANGNYAMSFGHNITTSIDNTMVLGGETHRVSVGIGTNTPSTKASLELADTDKGFLVNRLTTTQRSDLAANLTADDSGTMVYDIEEKILYTWKGDDWSSSSMENLEERITNLENATSAAGLMAVSSQKFNYQTSLTDPFGLPLENQNVTFRISILKTSVTGDTVYEETHSTTTSNSGLTSFQIGGGTALSGVFADIPWHSDEFFIKIEVDTSGENNYVDFGTNQLVSVPYALHAKTADRLTGSIAESSTSNSMTSMVSAENQKITTPQGTNEITTLKNEIEVLKNLVISLQKQIESRK